MLGEMYQFHSTPFFCLNQSSIVRNRCYRFWGKDDVLFLLESITRNFKRDHHLLCPSSSLIPVFSNKRQVLEVSKPGLQGKLDFWASINPTDADRHPSHIPDREPLSCRNTEKLGASLIILSKQQWLECMPHWSCLMKAASWKDLIFINFLSH